MKSYYFYSKTDKTKEPIGRVEAESIQDAVEMFAASKDLDIDTFLSIFDVSR